MIPRNRVVSEGGACSQIPQNGLIASYLLQGTAEDETGTYNGTETSMTYVYDDERGVVYNGGDSKYISSPLVSANLGTNTSASLWFKSSTNDYEWLLVLDGRKEIKFANATFLLSAGFGGSSAFTAGSQYSDGRWHHVIAIWEGASKCTMYVDGVYVDEINGSYVLSTSGSAIGSYPAIGGTYTFSGNMSNVHIYNRALTATEVTAIYNTEKYQHNNALDMGLIAYYPLDGNSLDNAINQYDGTDTNITYPTDTDMGVVAEFNGSTSVIKNTAFSNSSYTTSMTLSALFKVDVIDASGTLIAKRNSVSGDFVMYIAPSNTIRFLVWGLSAALVESTTTVSAGQVYHIVATYDGANLKIYINGVLETTVASTGTISNLLNELALGYDTFNYLDGKMSKARIYDRALSAKEIDWLYDYEKPNSTECLYNSTIDNPDPFEDGSGIALYKLDGNANDTTGVYDGTPTSITYADGEFGKSAVFNGSTSYINLPDSLQSVSTSFSFSLWLNFTTLVAEDRPIEVQGGANIRVVTGGSIKFNVYNGTTSYIAQTQVLSVDTWYHVVCIRDTVGGLSIYLNASLEDTDPYTGAIVNDGSGTTNLGRRTIPTQNYFDGKMDNVRFFNRALTADEVTKLYNERKI